MIHFDLPKQQSSIIKVIGVGGGGSNAVNYMYGQNIEGVDFVICNTDAKALEQSKIPNKIQLGPHLTQGLGAGADPKVGKEATEESLEEIKRILEVNTKMVFICAGMGGGTGTGGAPIVAKICRDLGILTVGIVTTPFGFEGPRRHQQAEEGIRALEPHVDTLLVISNDKLRMQYGNLKMKEAFGKADNVLATAAKCITDIINSKGHIIVDFADVCTVMKNGGVAILGSSAVKGEDRAQHAIEEALNSPLLNDSEIKGAKWILININSAEGDYECTMDEMEVISNHLRLQAGEETDVIIGTGYDNTLEENIGITLIATGFKHKDPFGKREEKKPEVKEDKIISVLDLNTPKEIPVQAVLPQQSLFEEEILEETTSDVIQAVGAPEEFPEPIAIVAVDGSLQFELSLDATSSTPVKEETTKTVVETSVGEMKYFEKKETDQQPAIATDSFLRRPTTIYSQQPTVSSPQLAVSNQQLSANSYQPTAISQQLSANSYQPTAISQQLSANSQQPTANSQLISEFKSALETISTETVVNEEMSITIKEEPVAYSPANTERVHSDRHQPRAIGEFDIDEEEIDQKRKAAERIQKLRNLTFSSSDPNNEFETVPAYVRRNLDLLGNTLTSAEAFYSKYTVKTDANNETQISSLNTFLDGEKPD